MSQYTEDMELNGCAVPITKEWNPYNPFAMTFPTEELTVLEGKNLTDIYQKVVLGYPGISVSEYCTSDVQLLKDKMDTAIVNTDEFKLLQWVHQLVQYHGEEDKQQVFQMTEDFYRSFIKDADLSETEKQSIFSNCWVKANLEISTIHQFNKEENMGTSSKLLISKKNIPFYNLKFITLVLLKKMWQSQLTITYSNLCTVYKKVHKELWQSIDFSFSQLVEEKSDITFEMKELFYPGIHDWVEQGQQYQLTIYATPIDILNV